MRIREKLSNTTGSALITMMVCMLLMTTTGGYMYQASIQNSHFTGKLRVSTQAQAVAEAGLAAALARVRGNWSLINSAFSNGEINGGTYSTARTTSGGRYLLTTTGTVQGHSRTASAEVSAPATSVLDYAIAAGGNANIDPGTGQATGTITGDVYAAGNVSLSGPSGGNLLTVNGDVFANGNIATGSAVSVSGSSTQSWSTVETFPTIDFSYYQTIATTNSYYYNGNKTYASGTIPASPTGGVIYVNGNVIIRGTQNTTACIVATGNIQIEKSGSTYPRVTVNQYSNFPAILTQGNIQFSSNGNGGAYLTTTGIVYASGNIQLSSGNHDTFSFTGSLIALGNIQTTGLTAWNTLGVTHTNQTPPGFSGIGGGTMEIESYNG